MPYFVLFFYRVYNVTLFEFAWLDIFLNRDGVAGERPGAEGRAGTMATIDGRPAQYGITLRQLRELMESRGLEGIERIQREHGGVLEITKKLYSSPTNGKIQPGLW